MHVSCSATFFVYCIINEENDWLIDWWLADANNLELGLELRIIVLTSFLTLEVVVVGGRNGQGACPSSASGRWRVTTAMGSAVNYSNYHCGWSAFIGSNDGRWCCGQLTDQNWPSGIIVLSTPPAMWRAWCRNNGYGVGHVNKTPQLNTGSTLCHLHVTIGVARGSGCTCTPQGGEKIFSGVIYRENV